MTNDEKAAKIRGMIGEIGVSKRDASRWCKMDNVKFNNRISDPTEDLDAILKVIGKKHQIWAGR